MTEYSTYPIYSTLDVLSHLDDENFIIACSANEELQMICDGKFKPGHQKFFTQLTDYLYIKRSEAYFDKSLLKLKEDNISWKDFYEQIAYFVDNIKNSYLVYLLIAKGYLLPLQIFYKMKPSAFTDQRIANLAAFKGTIEILNWLKGLEIIPDWIAVSSTIENGNVTNLKWLFEQNDIPINIDQDLVNRVAGNGHLEMLKFLKQKGLTPNQNGANLAAGNGRVEVLKWMKENNLPLPNRTGALSAFHNKHSAVVIWLASQNPPIGI